MSTIRNRIAPSDDQSEVMLRQVNLAAAFHDHISCTKASQQSVCAIQTSAGPQLATTRTATQDDTTIISGVAFESTVVESDHMYATDNNKASMLTSADSSAGPVNGLSARMASGLLGCMGAAAASAMSSERNQISRLTEMILGQLDLIQHQQEQLLKKDRQLQGLKQDREALCLRLEKMEKKIAVLMAKVATNSFPTASTVTAAAVANTTVNNNNLLNNNTNSNPNSICLKVNNSRPSGQQNCGQNVAIDTDSAQSNAETLIEGEVGTTAVVGLFTDTALFSKLCVKPVASTSAVTTPVNKSVNNVNTSQLSVKSNATANNALNVKIKTEPQASGQPIKTLSIVTTTPPAAVTTTTPTPAVTTTTTSTGSVSSARKSRKRHLTPETTQTSTSAANSTTTAAQPPTAEPVTTTKKRNKTPIGSESSVKSDTKNDVTNNNRESSCDSSLSPSLSANKSNKTVSNVFNNNRKRLVTKQTKPSDTSSTTTTAKPAVADTIAAVETAVPIISLAILRTHPVVKDILTTTKPYSLVVNDSSIDELCVNNDLLDNKLVDNCKVTVGEPTAAASVDSDGEDEAIEVPNWRLHPVSSCYSLEGTENLDDEVFNRRHQKLENDERRRKRWDIQRLREQRQNEKLRTGRYYSSSLGICVNNNNNNNTTKTKTSDKPSDPKTKKTTKNDEEFVSFYPDVKSLQSIEVTDKIPVIAFGHPIPKMPLKYFSLPWKPIEKIEKPSKTSDKSNKHVKPVAPPPPPPPPTGRASRSTPHKKS